MKWTNREAGYRESFFSFSHSSVLCVGPQFCIPKWIDVKRLKAV